MKGLASAAWLRFGGKSRKEERSHQREKYGKPLMKATVWVN